MEIISNDFVTILSQKGSWHQYPESTVVNTTEGMVLFRPKKENQALHPNAQVFAHYSFGMNPANEPFLSIDLYVRGGRRLINEEVRGFLHG